MGSEGSRVRVVFGDERTGDSECERYGYDAAAVTRRSSFLDWWSGQMLVVECTSVRSGAGYLIDSHQADLGRRPRAKAAAAAAASVESKNGRARTGSRQSLPVCPAAAPRRTFFPSFRFRSFRERTTATWARNRVRHDVIVMPYILYYYLPALVIFFSQRISIILILISANTRVLGS